MRGKGETGMINSPALFAVSMCMFIHTRGLTKYKSSKGAGGNDVVGFIPQRVRYMGNVGGNDF